MTRSRAPSRGCRSAGLPASRRDPWHRGRMSVTLRAADLPAPSRMDWWRHTLDEALGPLEVRQPGGLGRRDQLLVGRAGAVLVGELSTGRPGGASRTRRHIRRLDLDVCKVDVLAAGRGVVQQQGRQADLRPGDLTLVDLSRPVRWVTSPMRMVAVVFPRSLLPLPPDEVAQLTAVRVPGDRGAGALASSLARQLPRRLEDCGTAERARLGVAVVDLLTAALAARLQHSRQVPPDAQRRALLPRRQRRPGWRR